MISEIRTFSSRGALLFLLVMAIGLLHAAAVRADPLAQWQWINPRPQGNALRSCAYGAGTYVAVGDTGTIVTSPVDPAASLDSSTWTAHNSIGIAADLKSVAYGNKIFVAVGGQGTIITSPDGTFWTDVSARFTVPSGTTRPALNNVAYGNGKFYAVGDGGTILTSADGQTWTSVTGVTAQNLKAVVYSNYTFVAVGANGTVITLLNDGKWAEKSSGTANALNAVASDRVSFIAVGDAGTIITSVDGVNWSPESSWTTANLYAVTYGSQSFAAAGAGGTLLVRDMVWGVWNAAASGTGEDLLGAGYCGDNGTFAVVGDAGTILLAQDLPPGAWTPKLAGRNPELRALAYGNSSFFAVGGSGQALYSPDGLDWSTSVTTQTIEDINSVAYGNNMFVAVGNAGTILTTFDAQNVSANVSGTANLNGVVYDPRPTVKNFFVVGDAATILTSPDGTGWIKLTGLPTTADLKSIALGNNILVAVGKGGAILTSPDGVTWTSRSGGTKDLASVTMGFNSSGIITYVAVGPAGAISYSNDGVKWSTGTVPKEYKTTNLNAVTCDFMSGYSTFVAVGDNGVVLVSNDGKNWAAKPKMTSMNLKGISFINKSYWVVSTNGIILDSNRLDNYIAFTATGTLSGNGTVTTTTLSAAGTNLLNFGSVDLGKSSFPLRLTIYNTGNVSNLRILGDLATNLTGDNPGDFQVSAASCGDYPLTIKPGGSCYVDLTFTPTGDPGSEGARDAVLTVLSDDSATPSFPITLSGTGGLFVYLKAGPNGTITDLASGASAGPAGVLAVPVTEGSTPSFTIAPTPGGPPDPFYTQEASVDGVSLGPLSTYTFPPIVASGCPHTIEAFFSDAVLQPHTITATASSGGSITPSGPVPVPNRQAQPFAIEPQVGYEMTSLKVDGTALPLTNLYTFPPVIANHTIEAAFTVNRYPITAGVITNGIADSTGAGGTILPVSPPIDCVVVGSKIGTSTCNYGDTVTYSVTPNIAQQYRLLDILIDGASVGATSTTYNFPAPLNSNHTIQAVYSNQRDIAITLGPPGTAPNGKISPTPASFDLLTGIGIYKVTQATQPKFTITPNEGYAIQDVKVNAASTGGSMGPVSTYTFPQVYTNQTLDVSFVPQTHLINLVVGPAGTGTLQDETLTPYAPPYQVAVPHHATKVFTAVPAANYEVADVKVDGVSQGATPTYVFTDVTTVHTLEVIFRGKPWVVPFKVFADPAKPTSKIGALAFDITVPPGAVLPMNPDPAAVQGEVDPAAITLLPGTDGKPFDSVKVFLKTAATSGAPGAASVVLSSAKGFAMPNPVIDPTAVTTFMTLALTSSAAPASVGTFDVTITSSTATDASSLGVAIPDASPAVLSGSTASAVPATTVNIPGRLFNAKEMPLTLGLSAVPVGSEIHYTLDGSNPDINSTIYKPDNSVPILIKATTPVTVLKYFAISGDRYTGFREPIRTQRYVVDAANPTTILTGAPPPLTNRTTALFNVSGRDVVRYKYTLDDPNKLTWTNAAIATDINTPISLPVAPAMLLADGVHTLQVLGQDTAGNVQTAATTYTWTVDTTLPSTGISPAPAIYNSPVKVSLTNSKSTVKIYYTLDGTAPTTSSLVYSAPIPISSTTTIRYFAQDPAGNTEAPQTATYYLLLLNVYPPLSPTSADPGVQGVNPHFSGTFSAGTGSTVDLAITRAGTPSDPVSATLAADGSWSYDVPPGEELVQGLNAITVTLTDPTVPALLYPPPQNTVHQTVYVRVSNGTCPGGEPDGDLDRDGQVTMTDVDIAMRMAVGLLPQTFSNGVANACGDVANASGTVNAGGGQDAEVNVIDAMFILKKVQGIIASF